MDKTDINIDEEIIQRATNCEHDFSCLSGDETYICETKGSMGYDMLEIKPANGSTCRYSLSFGKTYFCLCPIRKEIYNRYNI
jgi:hypothetical protein